MRSTKASDYYKKMLKSENQHSPRFKKLKPEIVFELCEHRSSYENIKEIAVEYLQKSLNDQLELLILVDKCDYSNMEKLSNNIFSWSKTDFLERRAFENCIWVDVLKKHAMKDCLEKFKIRTDLKEMQNLVKLIFRGLQGDLQTSIYKELREADANLNMFALLLDENENITEELQDYDFRYKAQLFNRRQTKQQHILWGIEETMLNAQTWDPIEMRFQLNWYHCQTEQADMQKTLKENGVQHAIDQYKLKILIEKMSGDNIRDIYYSLAEQHKHDLDVLQNRFDLELDEIDNKINYTRLQISKLIEQQKILNDQIETFHEEIKKRLEKEENEYRDKELERLRLEEETLLKKQKVYKKSKKKRV